MTPEQGLAGLVLAIILIAAIFGDPKAGESTVSNPSFEVLVEETGEIIPACGIEYGITTDSPRPVVLMMCPLFEDGFEGE